MERNQEENWHIVGSIPKTTAKQIGLSDRTPIWINDKILRHIEDNHRPELARMRTTAVAFVHKVVSNFDSVRKQSGDTLLLAIEGVSTSMVTYIKLERASENYWRVKSAHIRPTEQLNKFTLLWQKTHQKKPAKN